MSLPSGHTRLEYIESTGAQYIDTGFKPNQDTRIVARLSFDVVSSGTSVYVFGAANSGSSGMFEVSTGSGQIRLGYGSNAVTKPFPSNKPFEVDFNKNVIKVDGTEYTMAASTFSVSYSVYIFNTNRNGAYRAASKVAVYAFKIYNNGTLVRDFIPCKNASGIVGLWDDVNSVFYANSGSGSFVAGEIPIGTHKALVNGTEYEVTSGSCLVAGTKYDIKKGRTLIGGTGYDITFKPSYDPVFANNTWEQIIEACHNNEVPETWKVADHKPMTINGVDYQIDIIGKNHDDYSDGSGKAPLTFQLHDCYADAKQMNSTNTNNGGWTSCAMRSTHLPAILALMPTEVQNGIREVNKLTSAGNQSATINTTADKLLLLSEVEIFGRSTYSKSGEGAQYDYYKAGNSKVKKRNGGASSWWERSPHGSDSAGFCRVVSGGNANYYIASGAAGVAFGFCF